MEFDELQTDKEQRLTSLSCMYCHRWWPFDPASLPNLEELPCPHCGETGAEFRAKREVVRIALKNRGYHV